MTLEPATAALLRTFADRGDPAMFDGAVDEARRRFAAGLRATARPAPAAPTVADGRVPVRRHAPPAPGSDTLVVFLHGGGWVLGGGDAYDPVAARLAADLGADVAAVDYRLAPEHPFPAPLADAATAVRSLVADHAPARWAIVGDSAGANLAAVVAQQRRDAGEALPTAMLLVYPPTDFEARYPSLAENGEGYWLTARDIRACSRLYLDGHDPRGDPRLSPLRATPLAGLPPTIVATAGYDPLRDAGHAFADALAAAGVPVRRREHPGLFHGFYGFTAAVPAADTAVDTLHAELAELLS